MTSLHGPSPTLEIVTDSINESSESSQLPVSVTACISVNIYCLNLTSLFWPIKTTTSSVSFCKKNLSKMFAQYIWIYIYEVPSVNFQTFFVWALLLIVNTWNSSPLRSNLLWLQYTCCTVPTTSGRTHESPLVWTCQWSSSQPLSSPQLSHNDSLWA